MEKSILLLTNAYPDFPSSYRGRFIKSMAEALKGAGYAVSVVTPKIYRQSPRVEDDGGINVFRFPFGAGDKLLIEHEKIPYIRMMLYFITGFFTTTYVALKHRCTLIHAHWAIPTGLIGVWVGKLLKKPLIVTVHGSDFGMAATRGSLLRRMFLYVCRRASHVTCVSENMRQAIVEMGIRDKKIDVFPMGVEEAFFEVGKRRDQGPNNEGPVILSNRNLQPLYNVSQLIRAIPWVLKSEPDAKFLIAGEGQERERLEREAEELGVLSSVQLLGKVPHEVMPSLLAKVKIYVSTSLSDGTSVSLLEAMASGAFPVVTDILANREWIVNGENGFLVPARDERTLADKVVEAIRHKDLAVKVREKNRGMAERRARLESGIQDLMGIYESQVV
jgi:glycosyltransferase involved in cell wall biosynthesis